MDSKRERETGGRGAFKHPVWNQDFQFLVEDSPNQALRITIYDSPYTGRQEVRPAIAQCALINGPALRALRISIYDSLRSDRQ